MYDHHGWEFIQNLVIRQNFERFFGGGNFQLEDPSFYFHTFLWMFLPWVVPLGWMLIKKIRRSHPVRRFLQRTDSSDKEGDTAPIMVVLWFVLPILLMSLGDTKQDRYIFFVFPAAALIAGQFIADYLDGALSERETKGYGIFNIVLTSLLAVALLWMTLFFFPFDSSVIYFLFAAVVLFVCVLSFVSYKKGFRVGTIISIALLLTLYHFLYTTHISPMIMQYQPFRGFAQDMKTLHVPDGPVYLYEKDCEIKQADKPSINFYSGRKVNIIWGQRPEIPTEGAAAGGGAYIIVAENLVPRLKEAGYDIRILSIRKHYDIITPTRREFLFARTRHETIDRYLLAYITRASVEPTTKDLTK